MWRWVKTAISLIFREGSRGSFMGNTFNTLLENSPIRIELIYSVLLIVGVLLLREAVLRMHFRRYPDLEIENKRRWAVVSRNLALIVCVLGLVGVWAAQIQTLALSMVAIAAAIVLATKELIMCLSGSLMRAFTQQYSVGDYISVNNIRGRVVDINMLNTLVMEIGPHPLIGQLSGRTASFPNSLLLSQPVLRDNVLGLYVIHTFEIPVPLAVEPDKVVEPVQATLERLCGPYLEDISQHLESVQTEKLFITPAAQPRVTPVPHDDKTYRLVVRFAGPLYRRLEIQQTVLNEFMRVQHRELNAD